MATLTVIFSAKLWTGILLVPNYTGTHRWWLTVGSSPLLFGVAREPVQHDTSVNFTVPVS